MKDKDRTCDPFLDGKLKVFQKKDGYRFSIDSVLLASFALRPRAKFIVDLGTGCGIIPLIMGLHIPDASFCGVEIQPGLADMARENSMINKMADRFTILPIDMRTLSAKDLPALPDLVVCNPPYRKACSGRVNPDPEKAAARHEICASIADVLAAAKRILAVSGKFSIVYPAERMIDLVSGMRAERLEPKYCRMVHSDTESHAELVLMEAIKGGKPDLKVGPPLFIYESDGGYTRSVEKMYRPWKFA